MASSECRVVKSGVRQVVRQARCMCLWQCIRQCPPADAAPCASSVTMCSGAPGGDDPHDRATGAARVPAPRSIHPLRAERSWPRCRPAATPPLGPTCGARSALGRHAGAQVCGWFTVIGREVFDANNLSYYRWLSPVSPQAEAAELPVCVQFVSVEEWIAVVSSSR